MIMMTEEGFFRGAHASASYTYNAQGIYPSLEYNMRRSSVHLPVRGVSGARDNPRDSFPSFFPHVNQDWISV